MPSPWKRRGKVRLLSDSDHPRPKNNGGPRGPKKPPRWLLPPVPVAAGFSTMASLASQIVAVSAAAAASWSPPDTAAVDATHQQQREGDDDDDPESFTEPDALAKNILYGLPPSKLPKEEIFNVLLGQEAPDSDALQPCLVSECDALEGFDEPKAEKGEVFEGSSGSDAIKDRAPQPKSPVNEAPESSPVAAEEVDKKSLEAEKKRGFMMVAKVLFFMVVLVMGTKKIAIGVSISALAALLVEAVGKRLLASERPYKEEQKSVEIVGGDVLPDASDLSSCQRTPFELEENCDLYSGSKGSSEPSAPPGEGFPGEEVPGLAAKSALELEEGDPVEAEGEQCDQRPPCRKGGKTKRLLRRFVRRGSTASSVESEER